MSDHQPPGDASTTAITIPRRGLLLVLSSPSGAGKTSIARRLLEGDPHLSMSVSVTTRKPRPGEVDGRDYHFIDQQAFDALVAQRAFLEQATVFDHSYGSPREPVERAMAQGRDVLFDVDWQGTQQLKENARSDLVSVFIMPPSRKELERRLRSRAQDPADVVAKRMAKAADEISHWAEYDYIVVNHRIEQAVADVQAILAAERLRRERLIDLASFAKAVSSA